MDTKICKQCTKTFEGNNITCHYCREELLNDNYTHGQDDNKLTPEELERNRELYRQVELLKKEQQKRIDRDCGKTVMDYPTEPYMPKRLKDIAAEQQQEQEYKESKQMTKVDELLNTLTEAEVLEFLEKVPLVIDVNANVTASFFGKAWGRVKVTVTYKDHVVEHQEKLL